MYYSPPYDEDAPAESFTEYIDSLPRNADPEVFGMHDNANITSALNETYGVFDLILSLQPRASAGGAGSSRDDVIMKSAQDILRDLPPVFDEEQASMTYPVNYYECMNTVIVQEVSRYNRLLEVMHRTLVEIQKAINGQVVMSAELEAMGSSLFNQVRGWPPLPGEAIASPFTARPLPAAVGPRPVGDQGLSLLEAARGVGSGAARAAPLHRQLAPRRGPSLLLDFGVLLPPGLPHRHAAELRAQVPGPHRLPVLQLRPAGGGRGRKGAPGRRLSDLRSLPRRRPLGPWQPLAC